MFCGGRKKGKITYFQTRPGVKLLLDNWLNMILNISDNGSWGSELLQSVSECLGSQPVSLVCACFCRMLLCSLTDSDCFHNLSGESINVLQFPSSPLFGRLLLRLEAPDSAGGDWTVSCEFPERIVSRWQWCSVSTLTRQVYNWTKPRHYFNRKLKISPTVFPFCRGVVYKYNSSETRAATVLYSCV